MVSHSLPANPIVPLRAYSLDGAPPPDFDCGRDEQNQHLHARAWEDQQRRLSTTYLLHRDGLVAGYATVCMDSLPLARRERGPTIRYQHVSALKLAQLGVDRRFQGLGIGREAVGFVVRLAVRIADQVGCRYVTLDAQPDLVGWYTDQGFVPNRLRQEQRLADAILHRREPGQVPVSMRFDLGAAH